MKLLEEFGGEKNPSLISLAIGVPLKELNEMIELPI